MAGTFTPEQISQILEEFFRVVGTRQYIGARYVPLLGRKDETSIEWDNAAPYEPLTIVLYQGNSYTSRQYVPVGVEITNQEFWAMTGNYNAQIEQYRQDTALARETAENVQHDIDTLLPKSAFSDENTVKTYIDNAVTDIAEVLPIDDFTSTVTVKKYIEDEVSDLADTLGGMMDDIKAIIPSSDFTQTDTVKDYVDGEVTTLTDLKIPWPTGPNSKLGNLNQVLATLANGATKWVNPVEPTDEQAEEYITQWLNAHPEATTTVADGAITDAKIASQPFTQDTNTHSIMHRNVPIGTDLNGFLGTYFFIMGYATAYEHCPIAENNRRMFLVFQSYYNYFAQAVINLTTGELFVRYSAKSGSTWGNWARYDHPIADGTIVDSMLGAQPFASGEAPRTVLHMSSITGTDLNAYLGTCFTVLAFSTEYDNCPIPANNRRILFCYQVGHNYLIQVIMNVVTGEMFTRFTSSTGATWGAWAKYEQPAKSVDTPNVYSISPTTDGYGAKASDTIRVMSYNVCQYDNDTQVDISDQKLANLKAMILDANCDVLGWQESTATINDNTSDDKSALYYVFYPIYPYVYRPNLSSLSSKIPFVSGSQQTITLTSGRPCSKADVLVNSKRVSIYSIHTTPNFSAAQIAARETDMRELKTALDNDSNAYKIVCGDFNIDEDEIATFETIFSDYQHVNGGYAGWFETTGRYRASRGTEYPMDNIIFTSNIQLSYMKAYKEWYNALYSDHIPVVAEFRLV